MAACESNRQSRQPAGVLLNSTNYIGLSKVEKRIAKTQTSPSYRPQNHSISRDYRDTLEPIRRRKRLPVWELKVKGATVVLESVPLDTCKHSYVKIRTGQYFDVKRCSGQSFSVTPMKARGGTESTASQGFRKAGEVLGDEKEGLGWSHPRSISVEPDEQYTSSSRTLGHNNLLSGKTMVYSARKDSAAAYRSKMRDKSPVFTPCRRRKPEAPQNRSVLLKKVSSEESPTKKLYRRMLQRASEQIERENFGGWE